MNHQCENCLEVFELEESSITCPLCDEEALLEMKVKGNSLICDELSKLELDEVSVKKVLLVLNKGEFKAETPEEAKAVLSYILEELGIELNESLIESIEVLNEFIINPTSELSDGLVSYIRTGTLDKVIANMAKMYKLVTDNFKLTLKGLALAAGLPVRSTDTDADIDVGEIKKAVRDRAMQSEREHGLTLADLVKTKRTLIATTAGYKIIIDGKA